LRESPLLRRFAAFATVFALYAAAFAPLELRARAVRHAP